MITVHASTNPFRDEWIIAEVAPGQTIRQIVGDAPVHAWIDGHAVPAELIEKAKIKDGVTVVVRPVPQGDDLLGPILQISIAIAAGAISGGFLLPASVGAFGSIAAGVGVAIGGSLLVNALVPPASAPPTSSPGQFNRLASLTGSGNQMAAFTPIPRLYGKYRFFPPIPMTAQPFTELEGSDQYLRMLLVLGYGPLQIGGVKVGPGFPVRTETTSFSGTPIRIGDTDIKKFEGIEFEIGTPAQMTLYTNQVFEESPGWTTRTNTEGFDSDDPGQWVIDGESHIMTTDTDAIEISIDVSGSLFSIDSKARTKQAKVDWKIEVRPTGTGAWTTVANPWTVVNQKRETVRRGRRWRVPQGQYDVRLTRIRTYHGNFEGTQNEMTWSALRTIRKVKRAFDVPNTVTMALRIKATDQLNGMLDDLSVLAESVLPVFNGTSWVEQATSNPAWIYADIWTGTANRRPEPKSALDTAELLDWAAECNAAGRTYNAVLDSGGTTLDRVQEVAAIGRAVWALNEDGKISVVQDRPQTSRMVISPRNSFGFSYEIAAVEIPHALRVQFIDGTTWESAERLVFDDGYSEANATLYETLKAPGVTNAAQAWKYGRYHLAQQRLRPERYYFSQDVQHLRYRRGDQVELAHDVILVGTAQGRIKGVTTNGAGNATGVAVDEFLFMGDGTSYAIQVQRSDGSIAVSPVVTAAPGTTELTLTTPLANIEPDDHFQFGEAGKVSIPVKVVSISPQGEFGASVVAVPAAPDILDAETGDIPTFEPGITQPIDLDRLPLPVPTLTRIASDESVLLRDGDGSVRIRMLVESTVAGFPGWDGRRQIRYRTMETEDWTLLEPSRQDAQSILEVDEGVSYQVQIRSVRGSKVSEWTDIQQHTVIGKSSPPHNVTGFQALAARDRVELSWSAVPDPDLGHYEIREGTHWSTGVTIARIDGTKFQTPRPSSGPWWLKAVDTSGNESLAAAKATIDPVKLSVTGVTVQVVDNNVLLRWTWQPGTFDLETFQIRKGQNLSLAEVTGVADTTFATLFETVKGTFTYWVVPIDTAGIAGNAQSVRATVAQPPDFILQNNFSANWGAAANVNIGYVTPVGGPARLLISGGFLGAAATLTRSSDATYWAQRENGVLLSLGLPRGTTTLTRETDATHWSI